MLKKQLRIQRCPLCGKNVEEMKVAPFLWHCISCKMAWLTKKPKTQYEQEYYQGKSTLASWLFTPIANFFYFVRNLYVGFGKKRLWVDVGAGDGSYLENVDAERKIGVELSSIGRKMIRQRGFETMSPDTFLKTRGLGADVISFWQVLEHTDKPWLFLRSARRNIKKNGKIVIGVPNIDSFEFSFFGKRWFHLAPSYHLWHFSPTSISKILEREGFKIESIDYWAPEHQLAGLVQSFINFTASSDNVLHKIVKRGDGGTDILPRDIISILFWLTIGLPVIFGFWIFAVINRKPGTVVVIAHL